VHTYVIVCIHIKEELCFELSNIFKHNNNFHKSVNNNSKIQNLMIKMKQQFSQDREKR